MLFSFNAGRNASEFTGFSTQWYGKALSNGFLIEALQNSLIVAFVSAALAAIFGTMAAVGHGAARPRLRAVFDGLFAAAIVVPGVVIGIATLVALVELFAILNPALAAIWPGEAAAARPRLRLDHRRSRPVRAGAGDDDRAGAHRRP